MLKKESIFPYKQMNFLFYVGHLGPGYFGTFLDQLILEFIIRILMYNTYL